MLDHAADRATQYERERYWTAQVRSRDEAHARGTEELPNLDLPPRDALVLCGFVRNAEHSGWVDRTGLYNVRADERRGALSADSAELRAEWLLLYGPASAITLSRRSGAWFVQTREQLLELGYPNPRGTAYLCCSVERESETPTWLAQIDPDSLRPPELVHAHPFATSWADLLAMTNDLAE